MSKKQYKTYQKHSKAAGKQLSDEIDPNTKLKQILQLDKLLRKYHDHLVNDQNPLTSAIHSKLNYIQKIRKNKKKIIGLQKDSNRILSEDSKISIKCYICRGNVYENVENNKFCKYCWEFNQSKRTVKVNMTGKVALITGGRIKIGFQTALSLLRNGCKVILTSRFADDALNRYKQEQDYEEFKDRLQIIQVCFSKIKNVMQMVSYIKRNYQKIDILINNAAQTIRRPQVFYENVIKNEIDKQGIIKAKLNNFFNQSTLQLDLTVDKQLIEKFVSENYTKFPEFMNDKNLQFQINTTNQQEKISLVSISNLPIVSRQILQKYNQQYFPDRLVDQHKQQIDLRPVNSWIQRLQDVHIIQVIQVLMINLIAPLIIIQELYPLLKKQQEAQSSYIINVSSMQGNFSRRSKTHYHPQTNIAKAGLNMLTRTAGESFKKDYNIVMVAVDTGWNTIQQPNSYHMQSPIDCKDGAARILDPIYRKLTKSGIFYKNFDIFEW